MTKRSNTLLNSTSDYTTTITTITLTISSTFDCTDYQLMVSRTQNIHSTHAFDCIRLDEKIGCYSNAPQGTLAPVSRLRHSRVSGNAAPRVSVTTPLGFDLRLQPSIVFETRLSDSNDEMQRPEHEMRGIRRTDVVVDWKPRELRIVVYRIVVTRPE